MCKRVKLDKKIKYAYSKKIENFGKEVIFSYPNETLAVSTTKNKCSLKCAHCNGHYLNNMVPIEEYEDKIKSRNITSFFKFDNIIPSF